MRFRRINECGEVDTPLQLANWEPSSVCSQRNFWNLNAQSSDGHQSSVDHPGECT